MSLMIKCFPKGMYGENTYLITDAASGLKAIVDPGYFGDDVKAEIGDGTDLRFILLTHAHHDHFYAASDYISEYPGAVFAAPAAESYLISEYNCPEPSLRLSEGDVIKLGETELRVIETPGHTEGGACFATDREIFTGDTLFRLSVGRSDLETGDWFTLLNSIKEKLYTLDEELIVYPGHGDTTSIGYEKKANPFV